MWIVETTLEKHHCFDRLASVIDFTTMRYYLVYFVGKPFGPNVSVFRQNIIHTLTNTEAKTCDRPSSDKMRDSNGLSTNLTEDGHLRQF